MIGDRSGKLNSSKRKNDFSRLDSRQLVSLALKMSCP